MSPRIASVVGGWAASLLLGAACSAVLNPERLDDVVRCGTNADCPKLENNRHENVCRYGDSIEGDPTGFDQVCVPEFAQVDCQAQASGVDSEFAELWAEAQARKTLYIGSCEGHLGGQGCYPGKDGCQGGLVPHAVTGLCDDQDESTFPAVGDELDESFVGLDIQDQFCKSYFCDSDFVCDQTKGKNRCVRCDPARGFAKGGCFDLYLQGERSSVYLSAAENAADCPAQASRDDVKFGSLPEQVPGT